MSSAIQPVGVWAQSTGEVTTEANGRMGKTEFLALLIAQMKYQDPLNPMDNTAMVAQMAQFSQLEQSLAMTEAMTELRSISMVGKFVTSVATDGTRIGGRVVGVSTGEDPILTLEDGSFVALKDVQTVTDAYTTLDSLSMLGKIVKYYDVEGNRTEGLVSSVTTGANPLLTLSDGYQLYLSQVAEVTY